MLSYESINAWALKRKVLGAFDKYLDIVSLLPINAKSAYDLTI